MVAKELGAALHVDQDEGAYRVNQKVCQQMLTKDWQFCFPNAHLDLGFFNESLIVPKGKWLEDEFAVKKKN